MTVEFVLNCQNPEVDTKFNFYCHHKQKVTILFTIVLKSGAIILSQTILKRGYHAQAIDFIAMLQVLKCHETYWH